MCIRGKNKPIIEGKRLLIYLLIKNIFSKLILPLHFKTEVCLNKEPMVKDWYVNFEVESP